MAEKDFLDEVAEERTAQSPGFPRMLEAATRRRELLNALAEKRREHKRSQTAVAAAMESSQSSIARLESSATDARISTVDRYAQALGYRIQYHLVPEGQADPTLVVHPRSRQSA
jgi:seryl-tRNA synthetase